MSNPRRVFAGALGLCLVAVAIAGCGGGSDDSETSGEPTTLSSVQWTKQADGICQKGNDEQEALLRKQLKELSGQTKPTNEDQETFVLNAVGPLKKAAAGLEELGLPTGKEEKAEAFVDAMHKAIGEIEEEPLDFLKGESRPYVPVERLGKELGLKVCTEP